VQMADIEVVTPKDMEIERLNKYRENQFRELQFYQRVLDYFLMAYTDTVGKSCYCKYCKIALNHNGGFVCEFYDENTPRPPLLCIMVKLADCSMLNHTEKSDYVLPVLREICETLDAGNSFCLKDIISKHMPSLLLAKGLTEEE